MSIFGKNIKYLRQSQGLSQQQFANLFELSRGSIGSYEEGRADPKIETLIKIASFFQVSIDDLVTGQLGPNTLSFKESTATFEEKKSSPKEYLEDRLTSLEDRFSKIEAQLNRKHDD